MQPCEFLYQLARVAIFVGYLVIAITEFALTGVDCTSQLILVYTRCGVYNRELRFLAFSYLQLLCAYSQGRVFVGLVIGLALRRAYLGQIRHTL